MNIATQSKSQGTHVTDFTVSFAVLKNLCFNLRELV